MIDYMIITVFFIWYVTTFGERNDEGWQITGLPALVPILFWFLWLVVIEAICGTTLGHELVGLKIVSIDGSKIDFLQALKRRICDAVEISWCFGLIAYILVKNTKYNQRLGDIWAKCLVVDKNEKFLVTDFDFEKPNISTDSPS